MRTVSEAYAHKTVFEAFARYHRIVYSHNPLVNTLFKQFTADLDEYVPQDRLFLTADSFVHDWFGNDEDIADVGWTRTIKKGEDGYSYSLFLSDLYKLYIQNRIAKVGPRFPRGIPSIRGDNYFLLEDAIDWLQEPDRAAAATVSRVLSFHAAACSHRRRASISMERLRTTTTVHPGSRRMSCLRS